MKLKRNSFETFLNSFRTVVSISFQCADSLTVYAYTVSKAICYNDSLVEHFEKSVKIR